MPHHQQPSGLLPSSLSSGGGTSSLPHPGRPHSPSSLFPPLTSQHRSVTPPIPIPFSSSQPQSQHPTTAAAAASKLLHFIRSELLSPPLLTCTESEDSCPDDGGSSNATSEAALFAARRRDKVSTFMRIPWELEKLMGYGFFQCADAFLYVFTFLPLRCLIAGQAYARSWVASWWWWLTNKTGGSSYSRRSRTVFLLRPSDKCEMMKILILVVSSILFMYLDTNALYHQIKSQSVIKLYIFFNMLEVGDRLLGCFSQDALDALFITATEQHVLLRTSSSTSPTPACNSPPDAVTANKPLHRTPSTSLPSSTITSSKQQQPVAQVKKLSTTVYALICGVSILSHALVILAQSTTLSVAINANNRALLTVMMSNNFVELKGSVFKKFDKMNLFQVTCSDIRERFHLFVLLLIVCLQTLREYSWEEARFWVLLPDCLFVLLAEIFVDWVKHAFITRFNEIPLHVYEHYTRSLAYDMADSFKRKSSSSSGRSTSSSSFSSDYSDVVGRRLGFVPLPLAIVLIRVMTPMWRIQDRMVGIVVLTLAGYVALASFRILNMIVLVGKAVRIIDAHSAGSGSTGPGSTNNNPVPPGPATSDVQHNEGVSGTGTTNYTTPMGTSSTIPVLQEHQSGSSGTPVPVACAPPGSSNAAVVRNSILKRTRTISGSDGDLLIAMKNEQKIDKKLKFANNLKQDHESDDHVIVGSSSGSTGSSSNGVGVGGVPGPGGDLQKIHLLANSNVSLYSVGFNEEMMKVDEELRRAARGLGEVDQLETTGTKSVLSERKHSLGSNVVDEGVLLLLGGTPNPAGSPNLLQQDDQERVVVKTEPLEKDQLTDYDDDDNDDIDLSLAGLSGDHDDDAFNRSISDPLNQTIVGVTVKVEESDGSLSNDTSCQTELQCSEAVKLEDVTTRSATTTPEPAQQLDQSTDKRPNSGSGKKKLMSWFK